MGRTLKLYQLENGYCYNSDSLFLYAFARDFMRNGASVLDVGAGCGVLGLLCARDFEVSLVLNDINPLNIQLCHKNAILNTLDCEILLCDVLESNFNNTFDFIISNPPFYRQDSLNPKNKHTYLSKKSENLPINAFLKFAKRALKQKGKVIFCYDAKALLLVLYHLKEARLNCDYLRFVYPRANKNASLAMFACSNSKGEMKILPPLVNFSERENTREVKEIFDICNTFSIKITEDLLEY